MKLLTLLLVPFLFFLTACAEVETTTEPEPPEVEYVEETAEEAAEEAKEAAEEAVEEAEEAWEDAEEAAEEAMEDDGY